MKLKPLVILGFVFLSIFNCKSAQEPLLQFQTTAPIDFSEPYYNSWVAGIEGGGAGINVFLPTTKPSKIIIDSLHFRGEKSAVETRDQLIIGRFKYTTTRKKDIIFSSDRRAEYGNTPPTQIDASPFTLSQNECVISYQVKNKRLYYKISNLKKGGSIAYPSAPPKKP
tara:strand:- start:9779 stop:10282 length:504 start_codon:yes stop_codon:yes gene_type:complete